MGFAAKWIKPIESMGDVCPVFQKKWACDKKVEKAELTLTAMGTYVATLNGERISDYVLAPGWTSYKKRLQYQEYDITEKIEGNNELSITVGKGWFRSPIPGWIDSKDKEEIAKLPAGLWGEIRITYTDGSIEIIPTDQAWTCKESATRFSEIYDGECYDASFCDDQDQRVMEFDWAKDILIRQEGESIKERERIAAKKIINTPSGETVIDFGQEITGYVEFSLLANKGDKVKILHGEVLDKDGNFYNENYRSAKSEITYFCKDGKQVWHPQLTFFGFRYIKLEDFPAKPSLEQFTAIAVYSDLKRTGAISCSNAKLNQLFSNIFWGQKGNFLDVPTDCPQRDERLGWTGDAQVFVKAASYNFDVEVFFRKWLRDLAADQYANGGVGHVIPDVFKEEVSAAWGDAAVICPWQIYMTYGNEDVLREQFSSMKMWVDYITNNTSTDYLWTGGVHFGDWLGLDAPVGSYKGSSREELIASAFYAFSTKLLIKAGRVIGQEVSAYEKLYGDIVERFQQTYSKYHTQTECVLAVWFGLAKKPQETVEQLATMIKEAGNQIQTGFVGTPYILHVLSNYGYTKLAYSLLLREEYPSWLYSVNKGATTIWEHWDGIMENGDFWSDGMNSFNHYAYGAVADWVYEEAAGISTMEDGAGFKKIKIEPKVDKRLDWLEASILTRNGKVTSRWTNTTEGTRYEIETPVSSQVIIDGKETFVEPGQYTFWAIVAND